MSKKMGIVRVTPALLKAMLQLPDGVEIERMYEDPPSQIAYGGMAFNIVLSGEELPVDAALEGQSIPRIYGECLLTTSEHGAKRTKWNFRLA